jgi:hypothetical protein
MVRNNVNMSVELSEIIKNVLDVSTIDPTRYIAPYRQTRWLLLSSLCFLGPSIYGYKRNNYLLANVALITTICSVNFWRDATYSYRRTADVIMAKISFIIFIVYGVPYVTWIPFVVTGYTSLVVLIYCYYMSNKHSNSELWWKYHMMFHLLISYTQYIAIKSIADYESICDK